MIPVTEPFTPPIEEYQAQLQGIWQRNWFTNNGPLVIELENKLRQYFGLDNMLLVSNGTIAIQLALKALGVTKKVITTPFSYVATTSSLVWEGCDPVFADIDPDTLNIDPSKIESLIDEDTQAILATHCFGNPCDIEAIEVIARKHGIKVIYDAAHCFGTKYQGKSIFSFGDVSTSSFHATKLYHTVEGGAVFSSNKKVIKTIEYLRNFGHDGPEKFNGVGINGKNSELHAAMGIVNLKYVDQILKQRRKLSHNYDQLLQGLKVKKQKITSNSEHNHAYYPIVFKSEKLALAAKAALESNEIYPRRYFYPSLSRLNYVNGGSTPISDDISTRILCLPLFHGLSDENQEQVARVLLHKKAVRTD